MANHKSAIKRAKQSEKRKEINKSTKTRVKNLVKTVQAAVSEKSLDKAKESLVKAIPAIHKAGSKGTLHKRNSARKVSRLMRKVNALQAASQS